MVGNILLGIFISCNSMKEFAKALKSCGDKFAGHINPIEASLRVIVG